MKRLLALPIFIAVSQLASAAQMTGFATQYYQDDGTTAEQPTKVSLSPTINIGKKTIEMEVSTLSEITSTPAEKDSSASWVCLHASDGTNYWFISDNEMGAGSLTAIAMAKDGMHKKCSKASKSISVSVANVPLLNATHANLVDLFGKQEVTKKNGILFYHETPVQDGFIQSNTVSYYFNSENVRGVIIGQITSN